MSPLTKILIAVGINVMLAVYGILATKRSALPGSTKTLLYIMSVLTPLFGVILFWILDRQKQ